MPTIKQKRAVKALMVNGGNITAAMREAGYAPSVVNKTEKLTNSDGFQELLAKYLPEDKVLQTHAEALDATKVISANVTVNDTSSDLRDAHGTTKDFIDVPDHPTRLKAVEIAYKLRGSFAPEKHVNLDIKTNVLPEVIEEADKLLKEKLLQRRNEKT